MLRNRGNRGESDSNADKIQVGTLSLESSLINIDKNIKNDPGLSPKNLNHYKFIIRKAIKVFKKISMLKVFPVKLFVQ